MKSRLGPQHEAIGELVGGDAHGFGDEPVKRVALVRLVHHETVENQRETVSGVAAQHIAVQRVEGRRGRRLRSACRPSARSR